MIAWNALQFRMRLAARRFRCDRILRDVMVLLAQVKQLKGPDIVGLGLGGIAPGEGPKQLLQAPPPRMLEAGR